MKMLANPGAILAALITAMTYHTVHWFSIGILGIGEEANPLSLLPIYILVRQKAQIPELQLQGRGLRRANQSIIISVWYALSFTEVDHGEWESGLGVKDGKDAVCKFFCFFEEDGFLVGEMMCREKAAEDTDSSLSGAERSVLHIS